jgi:sporadic carbohydrate cluster protein (TIGR04323 family)
MQDLARGYIASGEFNGYRTPQHLQNQIIKLYCDTNDLKFVLSRAEYWINGSTNCQLWAALNEGFKHIVFFSLWQLPNTQGERHEIYKHCKKNGIVLHFAAERICTIKGRESIIDIETLIQSNLLVLVINDCDNHLELIKNLI